MKRNFGIIALIILLLGIQIYFWSITRKITPDLGIVPDVPSLTEIKISSLGDEQFYFRYIALYIQNSGDTFGRFTAFREYNYDTLTKWFKIMDKLEARSHFIPALASYYYSNTQNVKDNYYIIDYLDNHYDYDPKQKWWWLSQAVIIANTKLKDRELALKLAKKLSSSPAENMPMWARQMPAFILEKMGELEQALFIIKDVAERYDGYSESELNFMNYYIKDRLGFVKEHIDKSPSALSKQVYNEIHFKG